MSDKITSIEPINLLDEMCALLLLKVKPARIHNRGRRRLTRPGEDRDVYGKSTE